VIAVKGVLGGLIAFICLILAGVCFYMFQTSNPSNTMYAIGGGVFALLMVVFGVMFLSGRVNKTEDIHITE